MNNNDIPRIDESINVYSQQNVRVKKVLNKEQYLAHKEISERSMSQYQMRSIRELDLNRS